MAALEQSREQQQAALALLNDLHAAGFTSLLLDSVMISRGGWKDGGTPRDEKISYLLRVVVDRGDLTSDDLARIFTIAEAHGGWVQLSEIRFSNGASASRICVWPGESK